MENDLVSNVKQRGQRSTVSMTSNGSADGIFETTVHKQC